MSASTIVRTISRGCLAGVLVVLALGVFGAVYVTLWPPFALPETGHLESNLRREVRLRPESPVAVLELDVRHDPRIFRGSPSSRFGPSRLAITTAGAGDAGIPTELRLYPADGLPVPELSLWPDGRSTSWPIDCDTVEARDCERRYLVVVSAAELDAEVAVSLGIRATLQFPANVPTPFLVSIGLDTREVPIDEASTRLLATEVDGSISVSPEAPVAYQELALPPADPSVVTNDGGPVSGTTLQLTVTRDGEAIPVGLLAPPPVRVAIVSGDGSVVVDVGPRPGTPASVALPPFEGEPQLVVWWRDRAAQGYRVDWRLERAIVGRGAARIVRVGAATDSTSVLQRSTSGESRMLVASFRPDLEFGVGVDIGDVDRERLAPAAGVLRLEIELDADATIDPLILLLSTSDYSGDETVPVTLRAGEPVELALDAVANCDRTRCPPWRGRVQVPGPAAGPADAMVLVRWRASYELWRLDPSAEPPSFYEVDQ